MTLPEHYEQIFNRDCFVFKQLKERYSSDEIETIKADYKAVWDEWKHLHLALFKQPEIATLFTKPKIESWTNGWNLRNHFWAAYRLKEHPNSNACLGVLANRKQLQIYLMYQHHNHEKRIGQAATYNTCLTQLSRWQHDLSDLKNYYIWPQQEHELDDHLLLSTYFSQPEKQQQLAQEIISTSFQIGTLYFHPQSPTFISQQVQHDLLELTPLLAWITEQDCLEII